MNLQQLLAKGGVVKPGQTSLMDAEWTHVKDDGVEVTEKFKVRIRKLSYAEMQRVFGKDAPQDKDAAANSIAECIRLGDEGEESLSYEQALALDPGLSRVFTTLIRKAHPTGPKP